MPKHCMKLNNPKTVPMMSPPMGPRATAAMAIGMMFSVMTSGPIGIDPMGVSENTTTIAVSKPSNTMDLVLNLVTTPLEGI